MIEGKREEIRELLLGSGAVAVGFAEAGPVDWRVVDRYREWLASGGHAGMEYMERYQNIREDTRLLLEGARTVCSLAFSYHPAEERDPGLPRISRYAYGEDYHNVIKRRLAPVVEDLCSRFGGTARVCVDSAPVFERWWGWRAGIGIIGDNGALIVKGYGSEVFLAEVVTTIAIKPDEPQDGDCGHCGACARQCPGGALKNASGIDCRRCLSYLTIEHRGEWEGVSRAVMESEAGRDTLFGCDSCVGVCPHNRDIPPTEIPEFGLTPFTRESDRDMIAAMGSGDFKRALKGSAISRARPAGLRRNLRIGEAGKPAEQ